MAKFRILSLDGGGFWALIQVMALINLYGSDTTGHEVLQDFDLAVGNSGGSIVLAALVENMSLTSILSFFLSEASRKTIFYTELDIDKNDAFLGAGLAASEFMTGSIT